MGRALTAPGYEPNWHIGVRVAKTGKLIAFISGIKIDVRVRSKYVHFQSSSRTSPPPKFTYLFSQLVL
jgi:hypothetical protein